MVTRLPRARRDLPAAAFTPHQMALIDSATVRWKRVLASTRFPDPDPGLGWCSDVPESPAAHEIGHTLGIGRGRNWTRWVREAQSGMRVSPDPGRSAPSTLPEEARTRETRCPWRTTTPAGAVRTAQGRAVNALMVGELMQAGGRRTPPRRPAGSRWRRWRTWATGLTTRAPTPSPSRSRDGPPASPPRLPQIAAAQAGHGGHHLT